MGEAKEYLQQIRMYDTRILCSQEELDNLRAMTTKITATWKEDVVSGSGSKDKLGDAMAKIIDLQNAINSDIDKYVDMKAEVWALIKKVKDPDQFKVLYMRYFKYMHWEQIACDMNMTFRNVCYIHGKALQAVTELLKGE